jgi:hypothetical protein
MPDVEELLSEYIAEHRAGGAADPRAYLERVEGFDRAELATLIDAYLARSPGRDWDAAAYRGSAAEQVTESFARSLELGGSGWWPTVLPRLRDRMQMTRGQVVERLSAALGAAGHEDRVGAYYHQMERGTLDSAGVSDRVLDALAKIYDTTGELLREVGQPIGEGREPGELPAMARVAFPKLPAVPADEAEAAKRAEPVRPARERDEIDELFTGGP